MPQKYKVSINIYCLRINFINYYASVSKTILLHGMNNSMALLDIVPLHQWTYQMSLTFHKQSTGVGYIRNSCIRKSGLPAI